MPLHHPLLDLLPGLALASGVTLAALAAEHLEVVVLGARWVDALVFAIAFGTAVHTALGVRPEYRPGIRFGYKTLLEIAIVLLGASVSAATIAGAGVPLVATVVAIVMLSLVLSYGIARLLGLSDQLATLVACGNSICGNSAIVAAAPVIGARAEDVASSISFTAALGVIVVLLLPLTSALFGLSQWQYGVIAGMTVYAVP